MKSFEKKNRLRRSAVGPPHISAWSRSQRVAERLSFASQQRSRSMMPASATEIGLDLHAVKSNSYRPALFLPAGGRRFQARFRKPGGMKQQNLSSWAARLRINDGFSLSPYCIMMSLNALCWNHDYIVCFSYCEYELDIQVWQCKIGNMMNMNSFFFGVNFLPV